MCVNVTSSDSLAAEGHVCFVTEARYVSPFHSCTWWDGSVSQPPVSQHTHTHTPVLCVFSPAASEAVLSSAFSRLEQRSIL